MNVALCLSGQPRSFELSYKYLKHFLIDEYNIQDVFCHFWWDPETNSQGSLASWSAQRLQTNNYIANNNLLETLSNFYHPKSITYDLPRPNLPLSKEQLIEYKNLYQHNTNIPWKEMHEDYKKHMYNHLKSIIESQYKVNQLKVKYEQSKGKKYDLVVRTRYDLAFRYQDTKRWEGRWGNFPSINQIKSKLEENSNYFFTEWDNLWIYSSELHDKMIQGMWNNFDSLFSFITLDEEINPFQKMATKASPEHIQRAQAEKLGIFPELEIGISCRLFLPNNEQEYINLDNQWKI